jgi:hypothetical protein
MNHRLNRSVEEMTAFCLNLSYALDASGLGGSWTGTIAPLASSEQLTLLLDDIHHRRAVFTVANAGLQHLPGCAADHCQHDWMDRIRSDELLREFNARIYYSGTHEDPRRFIEGINLTNGRHMWTDGSICPFMSSTAAWDWRSDTVADFIGHLSVWLISWMVFQQTTVWIVGEHGNTPGYHLTHIRPSDLCWCRSGRKYRKCHLQLDQIAFARLGR